MGGKVKWFSVERGYGYILADDGEELYFNVSDIIGVDMPKNGDVVTFNAQNGKKGRRASSVAIVSKAQEKSSRGYSDDRVECAGCGKKMVPRMITYRGEVSKSVCPFCGKTYKDFGWCFIATAVYGEYDAPEVAILRRFRDEELQQSWDGRLLIASYYRLSPCVAKILVKSPLLTKIVRKGLDAFVRLIVYCQPRWL